MKTPVCLLYSPILTLVRDRTHSAIAAALLHGTINGTVGLALIPLRGGGDLLVGLTGLAGLLTLAAANLVLYAILSRRPELGEPLEPESTSEA